MTVSTSPNGIHADRRRRILILNWRDLAHPNAGGAEVYIESVGRVWAANGHDVTLFCAAVAGKPASEEVHGVHIVRDGGRYSVYRRARAFYRSSGPGRYDLVLDAVNTRPFLTPRYVRNADVLMLIHQLAREVWFYEMPLPAACLGRFVFEPHWLRCYRDVSTVTVSTSSKASLERYGLRRTHVVPEGFEAIAHPIAPKESQPTIIFVGRLSGNKRPQHAIEAFKRARRMVPDLQLWIVGSGPIERKVRRRAPEGVHFFGRISNEEKHDLLCRAHALICTSVREGWGFVVTEAAAVGTPTIGYDVPGLRDSIPASNGVLVPARPRELASALVRLIPEWQRQPPDVHPAGVVSWTEVADRILAIAQHPPALFPARN